MLFLPEKERVLRDTSAWILVPAALAGRRQLYGRAALLLACAAASAAHWAWPARAVGAAGHALHVTDVAVASATLAVHYRASGRGSGREVLAGGIAVGYAGAVALGREGDLTRSTAAHCAFRYCAFWLTMLPYVRIAVYSRRQDNSITEVRDLPSKSQWSSGR